LESDIRDIKQNGMTIHIFYSIKTNLWDQFSLLESVELKVVKLYTNNAQFIFWWLFIMILRNFLELFYIVFLFLFLVLIH